MIRNMFEEAPEGSEPKGEKKGSSELEKAREGMENVLVCLMAIQMELDLVRSSFGQYFSEKSPPVLCLMYMFDYIEQAQRVELDMEDLNDIKQKFVVIDQWIDLLVKSVNLVLTGDKSAEIAPFLPVSPNLLKGLMVLRSHPKWVPY